MKDVERIMRAIEYTRQNFYPADMVFLIIAEEGLRVRVKLPKGQEDNKELLEQLSAFVTSAINNRLPLVNVETYLVSYGAVLELVDPDTQEALDGIVSIPDANKQEESNQEATNESQ